MTGVERRRDSECRVWERFRVPGWCRVPVTRETADRIQDYRTEYEPKRSEATFPEISSSESSDNTVPSGILSVNESDSGSDEPRRASSANTGERRTGEEISGFVHGAKTVARRELADFVIEAVNWPNSQRTSSGVITHLARPSRMRELAPRLPGRITSPGTAKTSLPNSRASRAVMRLPEFSAASVTSVPSEKEATSAFRMGKWCASGPAPGANAETTAPPEATMESKSPRFDRG